MTNEVHVIPVPPLPEEELRRAVAVLREEAKAQVPNIKDSDLLIERPDERGFAGGGVGEIVLFVGGAVASGITKKWIEEILWPKIKPFIKKYSDEVLDLLLKIPSEGGNKKKE